mmetsp:Transcript_4780/g.12034  ORF Transcript_4780/g.12034 Transcript_4780/m.12034 type:complete len:289 (-) Transcript_4780:616-1482(-)
MVVWCREGLRLQVRSVLILYIDAMMLEMPLQFLIRQPLAVEAKWNPVRHLQTTCQFIGFSIIQNKVGLFLSEVEKVHPNECVPVLCLGHHGFAPDFVLLVVRRAEVAVLHVPSAKPGERALARRGRILDGSVGVPRELSQLRGRRKLDVDRIVDHSHCTFAPRRVETVLDHVKEIDVVGIQVDHQALATGGPQQDGPIVILPRVEGVHHRRGTPGVNPHHVVGPRGVAGDDPEAERVIRQSPKEGPAVEHPPWVEVDVAIPNDHVIFGVHETVRERHVVLLGRGEVHV